jgi:adenylate cyclase
MSRKSLVPYLLSAFLISVTVICTDHKMIPGNGTWNILELKTLDLRFLIRNKTVKNSTKDIALIVIDEKSYKSLNQPLIFYHAHISGVIDYLVRSGAKVIALDIEFPSISLESRVIGGYESVYARSFLNARKKGVNIVIGFSSRENAPLPTYLATAGKDSLAVFSLTEDSDDFIRRQHLYFIDQDQRYDSFPYLIARKLTGSAPSVPDRTILIDYTPALDIPVYSFADVYRSGAHRDVDQNSPFRNKAVIIGTRLSLEDEHSTPLDYFRNGNAVKRTDGVVIQAATLNTLLSGSIFHEPDYLWGSILIFFVALLTVLICRNRRPLQAAALCALEVCILAVVSMYAFDHLYIIRVIPLLSSIVLSYLAITVFHYYAEERKKIKIRQRFASYVPENIIEHLVDVNIEQLTEGKKRDLALLFCDMRGFTPYSEKNRDDPQKVVDFLNTYHKEMTEIVLANNGTVSQLIGDGMFAFFGAPVELEDPAFDALKSALQMQERAGSLASKWREYGMEEMRIGIGIHYGASIVGNIGSVKKMVYGAVGDNTNIASRIEGLTKEYDERILISHALYEQVRERVIARPLGSARIKGHSEVTVYAVDGITV